MRLDDCGDIVTREQATAIFQYANVAALFRAVQRGAFPAPKLLRPARWSREELREFLNGQRRGGPHRMAG